MRYFLALVLTLCLSLAAQAAEVVQTTTVCSGTDVAITATDETVVATGAATPVKWNQFTVRVRVNGIMTTSANSTTYTVRIRRDTLTGSALGDALAENIKVTAGGVESFALEATDVRSGEFSSMNYVGTVDMAGADATTTVGWSCITTDILR